MSKKKVAITQRIVEAQGYSEARDALSHDWIAYLEAGGYMPVLIPNASQDPEVYVKELGCTALIISNGDDVGLTKNDAGSWTGSVRDITEARLLDWAIQENIPVLGVCHGMQFINCYFGGQLQYGVEGHVTETHEIEISTGFFREFYGTDTMTVNSYHRAAVTEESLGEGLLTWAQKDGLVEGFIHEAYPIIGIEWHPERQKPASHLDRVLIEKLFDKNISIKGICR